MNILFKIYVKWLILCVSCSSVWWNPLNINYKGGHGSQFYKYVIISQARFQCMNFFIDLYHAFMFLLYHICVIGSFCKFLVPCYGWFGKSVIFWCAFK